MFDRWTWVTILSIGAWVMTGCSHPQQPMNSADLVAQAKMEVEAGRARLLDVREEDEWRESHLAASTLIPSSALLSDEQRPSLLENLDPKVTTYLHCRRGGRAKRCAELLQSLGYRAVPLEVPYETLIDAGFQRGNE